MVAANFNLFRGHCAVLSFEPGNAPVEVGSPRVIYLCMRK